MELLIYSAGPYLERTMRPPEQGQLTIAVNDALRRVPYQIDWYCAGDILAYADPITGGKRPHFGWVCKDVVYRRQIEASHPDFAHLASWVWCELPFGPFNYSITAAYSLARMLGATRVTVFGADQVDDGIRLPAKSDPSKQMMRYSPGRCEVENRERERIILATGLQIERVLWTA
jgi:hypothetical protein